MSAFEENETSQKANGGTEIIKRKLAKLIDPGLTEDFQIIPSRIRNLQEDKIRVLWSHDLPEDPESGKVSDVTFRNNFHKLVFVSNWQYSRYQLVCGVPYDQKSIVIENGIDPAPHVLFKQARRHYSYRLHLHTTKRVRDTYTGI